MQCFFAGAVELDRCPRCGGIWFDWGELEQVTRRALEPELLEGHTERRCAYCGITLLAAVLPGGVPVETCSACRGLYLDAGELAELGGEEPPPPEAAPEISAPPPRRLTWEQRERAAEVLRPFDTFAA
jgi:Zn-finger nucleic acid-binding protein